jgi:Domain of unknown function (DUF6542)
MPRSSGESRAVNGDRSLGGLGSAAQGFSGLRFDGLRSDGIARLLGTLPTWMAMLVLAGGAALGVIITLIAGQEPGDLLGVFVILGSIAATLGIKRGRIYLLFPAPALTFFVAAILTGKVHDAKLGSSTAGLASGFTQWIAGIFIPAVVATILVLLIGGLRWVLGRQLITGQSPLAAGRPAPGRMRPAPGSRNPAIDDWADDDPFADPAPRSGQTGPDHTSWMGNSSGGNPRPARPPRDQRTEGNQRTERDQWGDPRSPADRNQPTGPRLNQPTGPRPSQPVGPRPNQGTAPRPRQNGQPRAPRPSFNPSPNPAPAPNPQRPRRQPPQGWTSR